MQNFQLYRSNVLLGGQMKYDLVVNSIKSTNKLYINEFHITPISNRAPYNKYVDENDLLNYTHQENISRYYKKFSGSFYNDYTDPRLTSLHPLTDKDKCKRYNDTYEMGCRRMEYGLYNTAFNFFCPIWLECIDLDNEKSISFEFKLYTDQEHKKLISCNELKLKIDENLPTYHNKFINYLNDYFKYVKLDDGIDWVIEVNESTSAIQGLNVEIGELKQYSTKLLYNNLTNNVRPLLEFNNMIINNLRDRKLITPQLFNFNLCFNIEDIFGNELTNIFKNSTSDSDIIPPLYVSVNVKIDEEELDIKDFFSNHTYISKTPCNKSIDGSEQIKHPNVLDYLRDYDYIDLIDKNKVTQSTIHWAYTKYPGLSFNFYNGFAGYFNRDNSGTDIRYLNYINCNTPNINDIKYNNSVNQYWCNYIKLGSIKNMNNSTYLSELLFTPSKYKYLYSQFSNKCVVNNIKYHYIPDEKEYQDGVINVAIFEIEEEASLVKNNIIDKFVINPYNENDIQLFEEANSGMFIYKDKDELYVTFISKNDTESLCKLLPLKNAINTISSNSELGQLVGILNNSDYYEDLVKITISNNLEYVFANSPSLNTTEIEYVKTIKPQYIERYVGKIKPLFIGEGEMYYNFIYQKKRIDDIDKKCFKYNKYQAKYPSIGYFPYDESKQLYKKGENSEMEAEYNFFNDNKIVNLPTNIDFQLLNESSDKAEIEVIDILNNYGNKYGYGDKILKLYNYKIDYIGKDDHTQKSIYNIEIKLK